jgi:hypothetical protein
MWTTAARDDSVSSTPGMLNAKETSEVAYVTHFLIITFAIGVAASLSLNVLFNWVASATGKRTGSFVLFSEVTRLGFLFWILTMGIYGLMKLGM